MTPWIVDASVAITWYLADEENRQYSDNVLASLVGREIYVPSLFIYELANAIVVAYRRKRLAADALDTVWSDLETLKPRVDPISMAASARIAALAMQHSLTCYDAAYLDLGIRTGFPIATVDKALIRAMEAAGVERVASPTLPTG